MKLSYSSYRTYLDCPRKFHLTDTGVEAPEKKSKYFALYGMLVESFFKQYVNEMLPKGINPSERDIDYTMKSIWQYILNREYVDWEEPWVKQTQQQIYSDAYTDVLKNISANTFWSRAKSEINIVINLKKSLDELSCRLDFIVENEDGTIDIIDGKGTRKMDKNVDTEQLYFYALMYLLRHRKVPDRIGFLYYRYQLLKYVDINYDIIMSFKNKLAIVKETIKKDTEFKAKVKISKQCKWCAYKMDCKDYIKEKSQRAKKRAIEIPELSDVGVHAFGI